MTAGFYILINYLYDAENGERTQLHMQLSGPIQDRSWRARDQVIRGAEAEDRYRESFAYEPTSASPG